MSEEVVAVEVRGAGAGWTRSTATRGRGPTRRSTAGRAAAGVPAGRHDHGERVADLRRRVRGRRDERREGGGARRRADRRDRGLRDVVGSVSLAPHGARDGAGARAEEGGARRRRSQARGDQRGVRRGPDPLHEDARRRRGHRERERRGGRARPSDRRLRGADRAHLALEMRRRVDLGGAAICGGGGQGDALVLRRV